MKELLITNNNILTTISHLPLSNYQEDRRDPSLALHTGLIESAGIFILLVGDDEMGDGCRYLCIPYLVSFIF
jgi:hypothetical protein